jgi:aminoglycoside phosphotransferase (APT) family kinase protein
VAELDDALLAFLETQSGRRPLRFDRPPRRLSGGFWAEISAFSLADAPSHFAGELILRRVPDPRRGRIEAAVQGALAELGFPSPRVCASGGPDDGLGRAFLIMDRARGRSLERSRSRREAVRRSLAYPRVCAEVMLRLHATPLEPVMARLSAAGIDTRELSLDFVLAQMAELARAVGDPELSRSLERLERTRPAERTRVLCHCDVNPNNVLVADDGSWSLIDWTDARLGEPELDVGGAAEMFTLVGLTVPRLLRRPLEWFGRWAAGRMLSTYSARAPFSLERARWYQSLARTRLLLQIEASRRGLAGRPPPPALWLAGERLARALLRAELAA